MKRKILSFICILLLVSCNTELKEKKYLFSYLPVSDTGIEFRNQLTENEDFNIIEYLYFNNGAGVAAGDINNDGLTDLYFTSNQEANRLYLNKGNLTFEDITEDAGVAGTGNWKTGVTMADVNGDGLLDIYVCQVGNYKKFNGKNQLFINRGDLTFMDEAQEYGLDFQGFSTQAAFFDYDLDGDLDMYLLNHSVHTSRSYGMSDLRYNIDERAGDILYRNDMSEGRKVFFNVTLESGIFASQIGYGLGVSISDFNDDGFPDLYVSNDFHENDYLYINNGNSTFSEKLTESIRHTSRSSMGNDIGDINNDGLTDIVVLDMLPDNEKIRKQSGGEDDYELYELKLKMGFNHQFVRNTLQLNVGNGFFSEIGLLAGIYSTDWSWSPLLCDLDNDGWKDLFVTSGIYRRGNDLDYINFLTGGNRYFPTKDNSNLTDRMLYEKMPLYPNFNYFFRNNRDLTFSNENNSWVSGQRGYSTGSAYADLDNDGDLDLIVNKINDYACIYRNNSDKLENNHYLAVKLKGKGLNTSGTGTRVSLFQNSRQQVSEQFVTRGFLSSSSNILHFGLGKVEKIDSIVVRWPDRSVEIIKNVPTDTLITLGTNTYNKTILSDKKNNDFPRLFSPAVIPGLSFRHREDDYDDFKREFLIPQGLTGEGPALAKGDVNGDKLDDLFIGGAKGQPSVLLVQQKDGRFNEIRVPIFIVEMDSENVDAVFFDADNDNDQDLYLVRGGNELPVGHFLLNDILLINDGTGRFTRADSPVLSHNGSCVRPCDFDNDGDTDMFVGSRSVPGSYGLSPTQYLLENDGKGHFMDVTEIRMKDGRNAGMVTDALWFDYDNDGDDDLVMAGEWMKVCIFRNDNGNFKDVTDQSGMKDTNGWWYTLQVSDYDGDGDNDLIGGNLGLNSVLKASPEQPVEMYINDFDNNGSLDQIICAYERGTSYPVASLDEIARQVSGIGNKFKSYSDFGGKTIHDIFDRTQIEQSERKEVMLFESCLFINNSDGTFKVKKLPKLAQLSAVRSVITCDADKDGARDFILAGNNYMVRLSLGRCDASYGLVMLGNKVLGDFMPLMPAESGLVINGDTRKIVDIHSSGGHYLVISVNNGDLQTFRFSD